MMREGIGHAVLQLAKFVVSVVATGGREAQSAGIQNQGPTPVNYTVETEAAYATKPDSKTIFDWEGALSFS